MRFLCLHGRGSDAEIFKDQTAKIRATQDDDHDYVYINGNVPSRAMTGMTLDTQFGKERLGFWPLEEGNEDQLRRAYHDLRSFVQNQGPFSGLMVFSEGASIAATLLIEDVRRHGGSLGIRCAIFFCGLTPLDLNLDLEREGGIRLLNPAIDGVLLRIPTAHIWSRGGDWLPGMGKDLMALCDERTREEVVHNLGHDVPGSRSDECLRETMRAIERTIEKANTYY